MKILIFNKLFQDIIVFFVTSLLLMSLIIWTIQAVNYFDFVTEDGHGLKVYFFYSLLNFPKIIHRLLPFIFFISVFYIIISYEQKNEIFIFWLNGISKIQFTNRLIIFSLIIMVIQIILGSYISPFSKLKARDYLKNSDVSFFTSLIKEGKFINITKGLTIFIEQKEKQNIFKNIFLEENNKDNSKMIYASEGLLIDDKSNKVFQLFNGKVINIENSKVNLFNFDQINFNLDNLNAKTITFPKIQELSTIILFSCLKSLIRNQPIDFLLKGIEFNCKQNISNDIKTELTKRFFKPTYIPLIVLFCCFLLLYSKHDSKYQFKVNFVFLMTFFLLVFSEIFVRYSIISKYLIILNLLIPIIIFLFSYLLFYKLTKNV